MPANEHDEGGGLAKLESACASLSGGHSPLCQHALSRLKALSEVVKGVDSSERERIAGELEAAVAEALLALEVQGESTSLVHKITTSQRFIARLYLVHKRVDSMYQVLGEEEAPRQTEWRDTFNDARIELEEWLEEKLELSTDAMLHNEVPALEQLRAVLAALGMQLELWPTSEGEITELQLFRKLADLMEKTLGRTTKYAETHKREIVTRPSQMQHQSYSNAAKNLSKIRDKATTVPGSDHLCLHVSNRLEALLPRINNDRWRPVITYFHNTASEFLTMLRKQNYYNYLLYRLATSQRVIDQVTQAHSRLDVICEVLGVLEDSHLLNDWRANWAIDRARQEKYFAETLGQCSDEELVNEVPTPAKLMETLTTLNNQLRMRSHELDTEDGGSMMTTATDLTTEMANLMSTTLYRITNFKDIHLDNAFSWFVSAEDIQIEKGKDAEPMTEGTFGQIYRGTWTNEWTKEERSVAIKQLFKGSGEAPYGLHDAETIVELKLDNIPIDQPDGAFTDTEWQLVASMIDNNPENRPSLEDAIQRMGELDVIRQRHWPFKEEMTRAL